MARFDPREKELARVEGWHRDHWVEFVLTKNSSSWVITVLVDGDLLTTYEEPGVQGDLLEYFEAEEAIEGSFTGLTKRFLDKEAA